MAVQTVTVPYPTEKEWQGWKKHVSNHIDAGDDVRFRDAAGNDVNIPFILLNVSGHIMYRTKDESDADKNRIYLINGGWHQVWMHKIFGTTLGGTSGLGIHVRTE